MSSKVAAGSRAAAPVAILRIGERVALIDGAASLPAVVEKLCERIVELNAGSRVFAAAVLRAPLEDSPGPAIRLCAEFREFAALNGLNGRDRSSLLSSIFGFAAPMLQLDQDGFLKALLDELLAGADLRKATLALDVFGNHDLGVISLPKRLPIGEGAIFVAISEGLEILRLGQPERRLSSPQSDKRMASIQNRRSFTAGRYLLIGKEELIEATITTADHGDFSALTAPWPDVDLDKLALLQAADETVAGEIDVYRRQESGKGSVADWGASVSVTLEACLPLPHGLLVSGWCFDPEEQIEEIVAIDYTIEDPVLSDQWVLTPACEAVFGTARDVRRFSVFASRREDAPAPHVVTLRLGLKNGGAMFVDAPIFARDLTAQRAAALKALAKQGKNLLSQFEKVYLPALAPLQQSLIDRQEVEDIRQFGRRSSRRMSLLIPLYRDLSFIRSQLMAFARDADLAASAEIVFIIDDPALADTVAIMIEGAAFVYDLDLRVVTLKRNGGYAQANNIAASVAEGDVLVLMNSDVVPDRPGWLGLLADKMAPLPPFSAIGPKLLYADGAIQHVGMRFKRFSDGLWRNFHDWKGFGRHFPPANIEAQVDALTGACLMIRKHDFISIGGLSTDYIGGDFEDSDLCLRLKAQGGLMVCAPQAELFHFERQSIGREDAGERPESVYNRLLHTHRWNHILETLGSDA
ncbi:GT2 family glycosyltransferase [Rhizobium sp. SG_E_25_P2]|uniref:glycosyltransferase family 2 protein n=1 Tax=Rhizobium sp. SG_E_25_P2 TaxID=2879942 RepID=UPI0024737A45|nr:glycosyltransferase family 2 protein [Rhizobium sp. SG_E_25_P2]MDH6269407.1 GT2 family glycosyltransferase [Rhizobium sp. SG_E_25_P2]